MPGLFITATGTASGKTFITRGLAAHCRAHDLDVAAIKPLETECTPDPKDALALGRACGHLDLAHDPTFYRVAPPLSPYAATLDGELPPSLDAIIERCSALAAEHEHLLIEAAGGLLVPIDRDRDMASLANALAYPVLIVAPNRLGVLSHARATLEAAERRRLTVAALVLNEPDTARDPSSASNAQVLRDWTATPVLEFPRCPDDDAALAAAVASSGLAKLLELPS